MNRIFKSVAIAAALTVASAGSAWSEGVSGTIAYVGDMPVPKGRILLRVEENSTSAHGPWTALARGGDPDDTLAFVLDPPQRPTASPKPRVVARLERQDGWLIARGSATVEADGDGIRVVLYPVTY